MFEQLFETDPALLRAHQADRLRGLLSEVMTRNPFYQRKYAAAGIDGASVMRSGAWAGSGGPDLSALPTTAKAELIADQKSNPPYGTNLTYPTERYTRLHQTSGTSDVPVRWMDTPESWDWFTGCWRLMLPAMGLVPGRDRLFFPFSFGPFVGFWAAFEGAQRMGFRVMAGGGMTSVARLRFLIEHGATAVFATPTYALRLAEVAAEEGIRITDGAVKAVVVAGEPGGSIPETRAAIERAWGARVFDHTGMTEIGPTGYECRENAGGVHILESEYVVEVLDPGTLKPTAEDGLGELVLTNLGRVGSPLIRYRTGDLVRASRAPCPCGRCFVRLAGGILGRTDDMVFIRGNNFYPSALESVLRRFPEIAEYRVHIGRDGPLAEIRVEIEPTPAAAAAEAANGAAIGASGGASGLAARVAAAVQDRLSFRADVSTVSVGSLPRFEMKARRVVQAAKGV